MSDRQFFEREFPTSLTERGHIVACATKRNVFYAAVRNHSDAPHKPGQTWALVALLQRTRGHCNFTYKEMSESMGPAAREAPAAVLDALSPTDNTWANEWRKDCRERLARIAARPVVKRGDRVTFVDPLAFTNGSKRAEFVFIERSTFTDGVTPYRIPNWRERAYTVTPPQPRCVGNG